MERVNKDYYKVLGVEKDATPEQIKKAYRKQANEHHPDKNDGKESEVFTELVEAYICLGDDANRKSYDEGAYTTKTESLENKAQRLVIEAFVKGLEHVDEEDVKYKNIVDFMKQQIKGIIQTIQKELKKQESTKRKFMEARKRISGKTGMLHDAATVNINQLALLIGKGEDELEAFQLALTLVDDYEYIVDKQPEDDYTRLSATLEGWGFQSQAPTGFNIDFGSGT